MRLRIATFNMENLDDKEGDRNPSLDERIAVMRPQIRRIDADVLCLQEVNGQEEEGHPRRLLALDRLFQDTQYANYNVVSTMTADRRQVYDVRNLVIATRFRVRDHNQFKHDFADAPVYKKVTARPPEEAEAIEWERSIFYGRLDLGGNRPDLHVINLHLKSRLPSNIDGQKRDRFTWRTASGWAEGFFISSMKRVGQALETRIFIDQLFDEDEEAFIVVCGDLNADNDDVPVQAIRGEVEETGNGDLAPRVMVPCERTIPEPSRFSLYHRGKGNMLDHLLASRNLLAYYKGAEIHNEILHDESIAFATDLKYPESDHAPVIAEFELSD